MNAKYIQQKMKWKDALEKRWAEYFERWPNLEEEREPVIIAVERERERERNHYVTRAKWDFRYEEETAGASEGNENRESCRIRWMYSRIRDGSRGM